MKTLVINSIKLLAVTMLIGTLLILFACKSKEPASMNDKENTIVSHEQPKLPVTDIQTATFMGDIKTVRQHIEAGSDLNKKDQYGSTPLIIAATFDKTEVALALIEGGANVNLVNNEGSTPLHTAAFFCRPVIVKALLEKGADKTIQNNYGSTPLQTVEGPFESVKVIYDQIGKDLGPLGLKLDYDYLEETRPEIAKMLR